MIKKNKWVLCVILLIKSLWSDLKIKRVISVAILAIVFLLFPLFRHSHSVELSKTGSTNISDIVLPLPRQTGGMPLMQALKERQSRRAFNTKKLSPQLLSDLLWAAFGINRDDSGMRTAPSAMNRQEVDVYVVMDKGAYLYDAAENKLKVVAKGDLRELTGTQSFVNSAPINLVFAAYVSSTQGEFENMYIGADVGYISQNVYLFCASEKLATVARGWVKREELSKALHLPKNKKIILAQTVGYPL
jgi:SagB-type dehydrogenase family enzyme